MKVPFDYQEAAAVSAWNCIHSEADVNPLIVMPTGTGKSLIIALLAQAFTTAYSNCRILVLTHVQELVDNNYRTLLDQDPVANAGIYCAGLNKRDFHARVTFSTIASFRNIAERFGKVDLIIVDEAHRISDKETTGYQKVIKTLSGKNPGLRVIGLTATPYRLGTGDLLNIGLFNKICFDMSSGQDFVWLVKNNYLCNLICKRPSIQVDDSEVKSNSGEFIDSSASEALRSQGVLDSAILDVTKIANDRLAWLIFAQTIADAELISEKFNDLGYKIAALHSKTPKNERNQILRMLQEGEIRGIANQGILTTGYDNPRIDLIVMLRMTKSTPLWVQMLGRGTRPFRVNNTDLNTYEGRIASTVGSPKQNCLVLDYARNAVRLGPINYPVKPKQRGSGNGSAPVRCCPRCDTYNHISYKECSECNFVFPVQEKLNEEAGTTPLIRFEDIPELVIEIYSVRHMDAYRHFGKKGKPDSVQISYSCRDSANRDHYFKQWVPVESPTGVYFATQWWKKHAGNNNVPTSVDDFLCRFDECKKPFYIKVSHAKYDSVIDHDFMGYRFELPPELGGPPIIEQKQEDPDDEIPF